MKNKYGKGSILRVKNCKDKDAVKILKERGFDAYKEGNGDIAVDIKHKERVLEVLSTLKEQGIEYESIDIRKSNLEEIFLYLTGARLSEGKK